MSSSAATSASVGVRRSVASKLGVGLLDGPGLCPHRARHPVDRTQLVDDGPPNAGDRVRLELDLSHRVEPVDGVDQADDPVAHEVGTVDVLRADPTATRDGHVLDQRASRARSAGRELADRRCSCTRPTGVPWPAVVVRGHRSFPLCPGMGCSVHREQPLFAHMSVDLRGLQAGVPEQLLDNPQVGATVEQVGGEAVAQGVGMGGHRRPAVEDPPHVTWPETLPRAG